MNNYSSYNSTSSRSKKENVEKAFKLRQNLNDVKNIIPDIIKKQFNFKGRKSPEIGEIIIETLTNSNGVVFDPFVGSGSYLISSLQSNRKFYGSELDNYTFDVVNNFFKEANLIKLQIQFDKVKKECFEDIRALYKTKCCNSINYIKKIHFDPEKNNYSTPKQHRDIKNGENIIMLYKCPECGKTRKKFDENDRKLLNKINSYNTNDFPAHSLIENSRINITKKTGAHKYDRNFSKRNKYALLKLQNAISNLEESHEKNLLQHFLVASLTLSKISQYGSGSEYIYQVMREKAQDMNVWYLFESKFNNFKKFYEKYIDYNKQWLNKNSIFSNSDYKDFIKENFTNNNKVDLILTDPPYYDQVPYLERNQLYRDWLFKFVDSSKYLLTKKLLNNEIIVSNSPLRKEEKNFENHIKDIDEMFTYFSNCVKDDGFVVFAVNLGKKKYFDLLSQYIINARKNGFEYITRIDKELVNPTLRKQAAFKKTFSKEMYLIFTKLPETEKYWFVKDKNIDFEIKKYVYSEVRKSRKPLSLNKIIVDIERKIIKSTTTANSNQNYRIRDVIKDNFKIDSKQNIYLDENKLYIDLEDSETLFVKLYDIIPVIIENLLLKQNGIFTLQDIYYEISDKLCSGDFSLLSKIINSESKENDINNLILNFCTETTNGYISNDYTSEDIFKNPIDLRTIDPYDLEDLIKHLLLEEGYQNVVRMGGAGDRGVDLIAMKNNLLTGEEEKHIFQVKRWIGNVGSEPIQRLNSVKITDGFTVGTCITTSDYTKAGLEEANLTKVNLMNGNDLLKKLNRYYPNKYTISEIKNKNYN